MLTDAGDGPLSVNIDAAHDAVRSAKNTVLAAVEGSQGLVCDIQTSSEGTAASREPGLAHTALNKLQGKGKDVALVGIDGCKDIHSQVQARPRINCKAVKDGVKTVEEAPGTATAVDDWHGLKSEQKAVPKHVKKSAAALVTFYTSVVGPLAVSAGVLLTDEIVSETVPKLIEARLHASFEHEYKPFLETAAAATTAGLTWADAFQDEEKLRRFGAVLEATGTVDLSILGDDDDDGDEISLCPGGAEHAVHDEGSAIQNMLTNLNELITEKNKNRKKQLRMYTCLGAINPDESALGVPELATILVGLQVEIGGQRLKDVADVLARCGSNGKKAKKRELVALVHEKLPQTQLIKGGLELVTLLRSKEMKADVEAALQSLVAPDTDTDIGQPRKKRQQQLSDSELDCIKRLEVAEQLKAQPDASVADAGPPHPSFAITTPLRAQLKPNKLSNRQLQIALKFYGSAYGEDPAAVLTKILSTDPLAKIVEAIQQAGTVVSSNNREYRQQHSHTVSTNVYLCILSIYLPVSLCRFLARDRASSHNP